MKKGLLLIVCMLASISLYSCKSGSSNKKPLVSPSNSQCDSSITNQEEEIDKMFISLYGNKLEVTLDSNSSVDALIELLKQENITYTADDYGGFEKVGYIGHTPLPSRHPSPLRLYRALRDLRKLSSLYPLKVSLWSHCMLRECLLQGIRFAVFNNF